VLFTRLFDSQSQRRPWQALAAAEPISSL